MDELKCWPEFFQAIAAGLKTFELRREDRIRFEPGQRIWLREWNPTGDEFVRVNAEAFVAGDQYFALPKWAQRFVAKVDAWSRRGAKVPAGFALTLLADIESGGS